MLEHSISPASEYLLICQLKVSVLQKLNHEPAPSPACHIALLGILLCFFGAGSTFFLDLYSVVCENSFLKKCNVT